MKKSIVAMSIMLASLSASAEMFFVNKISGFNKASAVEDLPDAASGKTITDVGCGSYTCYAIIAGELWSAGYNWYGELGRNFQGDSDPNWGNTHMKANKIFPGASNIVIVNDEGAFATGANGQGELGIGTVENPVGWAKLSYTPEAMFFGPRATMARINGELYGFGSNSQGQLGLTGTSATRRPMRIPLPGQPTSVSIGHNFSALLINGEVYVSGFNGGGQLGLGDNVDRDGFTPTGLMAKEVATLGGSGIFALNSAGEIYSTGIKYGTADQSKGYGQYNTFSLNILPPMDSLHFSYSAAIANSGSRLWGLWQNTSGQLGMGNTTNTTDWIDTGNDVSKIVTQSSYTTIYKPLGSDEYWAWGKNEDGEVGDGHKNMMLTGQRLNLLNNPDWFSAPPSP